MWLRTSVPSSRANYVDETSDHTAPNKSDGEITLATDQVPPLATSKRVGSSSPVVATWLPSQDLSGSEGVAPKSRDRRVEASDHEAWIAIQSPQKRRRLNSGSFGRGFAIELDGVLFTNLSSPTLDSLPPVFGPSSEALKAGSAIPRLSGSSAAVFSPLGLIEAPSTEWTAGTLTEAALMRFWAKELASWFDLCDSERHFELVGMKLYTSSCQA